MTTQAVVADDVVVGLVYTLRLNDGTVVDAAGVDEPLEFLAGHDNIIPGLERELFGLAVGDEKTVVVAPADAYGEFEAESVQSVERDLFPDDLELDVGMIITLQDESNEEWGEATVTEMQEDHIVLDFNHPLVGETLHFRVQIASLRPGTPEEVAHGHVHDLDGQH